MKKLDEALQKTKLAVGVLEFGVIGVFLSIVVIYALTLAHLAH